MPAMSHEGLTVYPDRIEEVVKLSIDAMKRREGLFALADPQPERHFVDLAKAKGPEFALNAVFLITPMVLGGQTDYLFKRVSIPDRFREYSWLFEPNEVARKRSDTVESSLLSYLRPAGREGAAIFQWQYNCRLLRRKYSGFVSNYLMEKDNDAQKVYDDLVVRPRAKSHEKEIRRFGPKIAKLFIQWVKEYDLYRLSNTEAVGLPVDFQVARVIIQTDGMTLQNPENANFISNVVLPLVFKDLTDRGYKPDEISKALWAIGSYGCKSRRHDICPLNHLCTKLISSFAYDRRGIFDSTDTGRYR